MANMSYCRYSNTLKDLLDCHEHWDEAVSEEEERARKRLLRLCRAIVDDYGDSDIYEICSRRRG